MSLSRIPAIAFQGTAGTRVVNSVLNRFTASPRPRSSCRTAAWVLASAKKAARSIFAANSNANWQAFRMSRRVASSRDKERLRALEDRPAPDPIGAPFDGATTHEVDPPAHDPRQLGFHRHVVEQAPVGIRRERHQKIHVAVGTKVGTQG